MKLVGTYILFIYFVNNDQIDNNKLINPFKSVIILFALNLETKYSQFCILLIIIRLAFKFCLRIRNPFLNFVFIQEDKKLKF